MSNPSNKGYRIAALDRIGNIIDIHERKAHGRYPNWFSVRNMKKRAMRLSQQWGGGAGP